MNENVASFINARMNTKLSTTAREISHPPEVRNVFYKLAEPVFPLDSWYMYQVQSWLGLREPPSREVVKSVLEHVSLGLPGLDRGVLL